MLALIPIVLLASITIALLAYAILFEKVQRPLEMVRRLASIDRQFSKSVSSTKIENDGSEAVDLAIGELEARRRRKGKKTLRDKLQASGLKNTPKEHYILTVLLTLPILVGLYLSSANFLVLVVAGVMGVELIPRLTLNFLINRRELLVIQQFATALDLIVRSLRSGLPLNDGLQVAAFELSDPLRTEFVRLLDDLNIGLNIKEALHRLAVRLPIPAVEFFTIIVSMQSNSGGNLAEGLSNLADTLRSRKSLEGAIKTGSSEAKSSSLIIGMMPILFFVFMSLVNYPFVSVLYETTTGNLILTGTVLWMALGVIVMRLMIKIEV
tara:strand:- start:288 stop:1259 length:972 start_codon:yes stop_codon:yes gene_type:complete